MAKNKTKAGKAPKDESAPASADAAMTTPAAKISKADAVRKAVAAGKDNPTEGSSFIKAEFGLDITPAVFSTYKTADKKRALGGACVAKDRKTRAGAEPTGQRVGNGGPVDLVRQVKELVDQYGVATVKEIADVFAK